MERGKADGVAGLRRGRADFSPPHGRHPRWRSNEPSHLASDTHHAFIRPKSVRFDKYCRKWRAVHPTNTIGAGLPHPWSEKHQLKAAAPLSGTEIIVDTRQNQYLRMVANKTTGLLFYDVFIK
jgi:hypothetical protein